jgi:predicted RNA-binding protein YlxR (DUF448 family)
VACRRVRPKRELLRIARTVGALPRLDATGPGRGAYVCPEPECVRRATERGGLARALGTGLAEAEVVRLERQVGGTV